MGHARKKRRRRDGPARKKGASPVPSGSENEGPFPIGTVIDGYRIVSKLGAGGMGTAYKALSPSGDKRHVTIKALRPKPDNASVNEYFDYEVDCLGRLDHPNLPKLVKKGVHNGYGYAIITFAPGETAGNGFCLKQPLSKRIRGVADVTLQAVSALIALERARIIHRDVKPENVIIRFGSPLHVTVIDLGLARPYSRTSSVPGSGTPETAAPQQLNGDPMDARDDQFSLAVTVYEWLSGRHPAAGTSHAPATGERDAYKHALIAGDVRFVPLRKRTPGIPEALETTVMRMMSYERGDRYASWLDVAHAFLPFASPAGRKLFLDRHAADFIGWTPTATPPPVAKAPVTSIIRAKIQATDETPSERHDRYLRYFFYALIAFAITMAIWTGGRPP